MTANDGHYGDSRDGDNLTIGSLCTGIGGLDLAVEAFFGAELAWYSEVEPAPCEILRRVYPDVKNHGDLTVIDWGSVKPVDIITAGYPCQPFSSAGKRKGASDARHLWPFIAEGVRHLRPRLVVLENVRGHLSLGFDAVLGSLAEAGFDAEWCVLRASEVGACHQRARLFIVARDAQRSPAGAHAPLGASRGAARQSGRLAADARRERHGGGQDSRTVGRVDSRDEGQACQRERAREVLGDRGPAASSHPNGVDDDRCRDAGPGGRAEPTDGGQAPPDPRGERLPWGSEQDGRADQPGVEAPRRDDLDGLGDAAWGVYAPAIERWGAVLGRPAPRPTDEQGRLDPPFVEWMMGYPEGWVDGLTRTQALKALGNAVVPQQAWAACGELVGAVTANGRSTTP